MRDSGRGGRYDPETYPELAEAVFRDGGTLQTLADRLGLHVGTVCRYQKLHNEFREAIKRGRRPLLPRLESTLFQRAEGMWYTEVRVTRRNGVICEEVATKKWLAPDTAALFFALSHLAADKWGQNAMQGTPRQLAENADAVNAFSRPVINITPGAGPNAALTKRWDEMRFHAEQYRLWFSDRRFRVVPAGRRSGKTELAKRFVVRCALLGTAYDRPRFACCAPVRDQAKRIYWDDLKALVPGDMVSKVSESELTIWLANGSEICVVGMDRPERIEGTPLDGVVLDEYGNMKATAWGQNVRPALGDRNGWAWFIGVPEGMNHYHATYTSALSDDSETWDGFSWFSEDILPASEIEQAKRDLDELTYRQEYRGEFLTFVGRVYYGFDPATHVAPLRALYNPRAPLVFALDFNIAPGVAAVCQETDLPSGQRGTAVIGEVYIPVNSTTPAVCRKLAQDWRHHEGPVTFYGDATGGAGGSAKVEGSDWDLVEAELRSVFGPRMSGRIPAANPRERARVNAMNARLLNAAGDIRLQVDGQYAPHVVTDLIGVRLLEGGAGEIDKRHDPKLTHISDAIGYYVTYEFPIVEAETEVGGQFSVTA